ncbi:MAG: hypothetical protein JW809_16590, partial [Pirellulales bacterium]|nr:hypothetical protein [Pirellulales bacterium]
MFIRRLFNRIVSPSRPSARRTPLRRNPARARFEPLEQRQLLSVSPWDLDAESLEVLTICDSTTGVVPVSAETRLLPYTSGNVVPHNANAAATTNTDDLQVGGSLGLDLTGEGYTVGMWEANENGIVGTTVIRGSHDELTGRVTVVDSGSYSNHATHVAGTIAASGVVGAAEGMATEVAVRSYSADQDVDEMDAAASILVASNHSYGIEGGWQILPETYLSYWSVDTPTDTVNVWWEDRSLYTVLPQSELEFSLLRVSITRSEGGFHEWQG